MILEASEIGLTDAERRLGFVEQTLRYPEVSYELSGLRAAGRARLERAVAIEIDGTSRIRRSRAGSYAHETFNGDEWTVAHTFATAAEVEASDVYRRFFATRRADGEEATDESDEAV